MPEKHYRKPQQTGKNRNPFARWALGGLALPLLVLALALGWHYPLGSGWMVVAALGWAVAVFAYPLAWVVALPALLPLVGWAPWTGWVTFEELDILILATAAGGYARLAFMPKVPQAQWILAQNAIKSEATNRRVTLGWGISWLVVGLFSGSIALAVARGILDAGGFQWGWYQGYMEGMNSIRVAKGFFMALLLVPLWRATAPSEAWSWGMALGLVGAALTTVWERMANTGLLNFASDYRTTGPFWEMNVGGAALDGYLALTVPFAVQLMAQARGRLQWAAAGSALLLGLYACLTTFSRGVYLAIPVGVAVTLFLHYRQGVHPVVQQGRPNLTAIAVVAGYAIAVAWVFPTSGYRGSFALMGIVFALMVLAPWVRRIRFAAWVVGVGWGLLALVAELAFFWDDPKSSYASFALGLIGCVLAAFWAWRHMQKKVKPRHGKRRRSWPAAALGIGSVCAAITGASLVMLHWGGEPALVSGLPIAVVLLLGLAGLGVAQTEVLPASLRWKITVSGGMLMALTVVGVFGGGTYITDRFSTGGEDLAKRFEHWQQGIDMLGAGEELQLGKGMGRYPASYLMQGPKAERVGDYRLVQDPVGGHIEMSGGLHPLSDGQLLRVSQRMAQPLSALVLSVDLKTEKETGMRFEICPKHLLYSDYTCLGAAVTTKAQSGAWQHVELPLKGPMPSRGDWYAPKFIVFSMAVGSSGHIVAVDNLQVRDTDGRDLLENGDFSQGLAHWFMSSDHNHLPWHIKNMLLNVMFDQGELGLVLFLALTAVAFWRVSLGSARGHTMAPAIAGAMAGFFVVGLFDSLLDVPRLAFLFYLLVLMTITNAYPKRW